MAVMQMVTGTKTRYIGGGAFADTPTSVRARVVGRLAVYKDADNVWTVIETKTGWAVGVALKRKDAIEAAQKLDMLDIPWENGAGMDYQDLQRGRSARDTLINQGLLVRDSRR